MVYLSPKGLFLTWFGVFLQLNLTDPWDDVELLVDLLVHGGADDAHFGESVRHRVNAHLRHQQRQQEDLILGHVVVLHKQIKAAALYMFNTAVPSGTAAEWLHLFYFKGSD